MQTAKDYLKAEFTRLVDEAKEITARADAEGRSVTADEKAEIEKRLDLADRRKADIAKIEENESLRENIERMNGTFEVTVEDAPAGAKTMGDAFVKSEAYQALTSSSKSGNWTSGAVEVPDWRGEKATMTTVASPVIQEEFKPGINLLGRRRLVVSDLMLQGTTTSNAVLYLSETTATNAAAAVAEGADKPESTLVLAEVTEPVRKIATVLPVSDEMLEDADQIRSYIDGRLRLFVQEEEDEQLLIGDGTAPNISGILDRSGIQTATKAALQTASGAATPNVADAIYAAITNVRVNAFAEPDGIVVHPTNWMPIRLLKDSALQYFGGGPFTAAYGNGAFSDVESIWGLPAVITPVITLHTLVLGAFGTHSQVFRKGGITIEATNSHNDYFIKNLTAIRAEERLALAVYRPSAFHAITALNV